MPQGFADSMTLQQIELHGCRLSLVTFAEQIQKEQLESSGSDMLKVYAFDTIRAVTSLMGTIHLVSQSNMDLLEDHKEQLKLLYEKVGSLLEFLDDETMIDLRKEIKNVAEKVEDEVESYIQREAQRTLLKILRRVLHLPTKDNGKLFRFCQRVIEDVDSIKENQQKKKNNNSQIRNNPSLVGSSSPQFHVSSLENDMGGHNRLYAKSA
ncbi:hypothetical protein FXO38_08381 [Capsicum annuum]|uniref:Rx N-terminal domain-containing protein n=1 Tax=Capsicum annuum TaxID=4072 RepID=A0A2G2YW83_CAPAN|nr:hypothetical protein FXO38_08381 [Capsicum annuum]PHT74006.1 hypothetical protein T459_21283 [Capsicum annuum]